MLVTNESREINVAKRNVIFSALDRKSTRLNSSHQIISYAVFCLKKKISIADSSEKTRTYNFPQDLVTDHRTSITVHNLPDIINGNIDVSTKTLLDYYLAERLL